jgi:hypothetical protein
MRPITLEEVDPTIKEIPLGKAPGLNGFITKFFQFCWLMIIEEVWKLVEEFKTSGKVFLALNATFFTLIPKEE